MQKKNEQKTKKTNNIQEKISPTVLHAPHKNNNMNCVYFAYLKIKINPFNLLSCVGTDYVSLDQ